MVLIITTDTLLNPLENYLSIGSCIYGASGLWFSVLPSDTSMCGQALGVKPPIRGFINNMEQGQERRKCCCDNIHKYT